MDDAFEVPVHGGTHRFRTTRWSLIQRAARPAEAKRALEELCTIYWPPLYAFARRRGHGPDDALDLTQGFFVDLLERDTIAAADAERGRFRNYLRTCFAHFLSNEAAKSRAQKRGGDRRIVSLDAAEADARYLAGTSDGSPEREFERRWARTLIETVLAKLRSEYETRGRAKVFDALCVHLEDASTDASYRDHGQRLGLSEGAVKVTVHRMRRRFRELLLEEVGQTVADEKDATDELRQLMSALAEK